jgi:hypothetical protein
MLNMYNTSVQIAITTLVFGHNPSLECRLKMWCHAANQTNLDVFGGNASIVLLSNVLRNCDGVNAVIVNHDHELKKLSNRFAETHKTDGAMSLTMERQARFLMKWQLFRLVEYDRVIYWDSDIDAYYPQPVHRKLHKTMNHVVYMPPGIMYAHSDHESPINGGVLIVRPDIHLYRDGLAVLERNVFNVTHGFDLAGRPMASMNASDVMKLSHTACIRNNDWHFVTSDSDQGLFSYMTYVRNALRVEPPMFFNGAHFWGGAKPFSTMDCTDYVRRVYSVLKRNDSCLTMLKETLSTSCYSMTTTDLLR